MSDKEKIEKEDDSEEQDGKDLPDLDKESPEQAPAQADQPAQAQAQAPQQAPQVAQSTPQAQPMQQPAQAQAAPQTQEHSVDVLGNNTPQQNALQGYAQSMSLQQDMMDGKIAPKTYHDLYENKGTLGKIGTLFGMMLSGAGSGLAHQPNLLMEMMNNEINRDFEAQKMNQSNKLNWYNAAMAHEKSLSDIEMNAAQEQATRMGTYNSALDAEKKNYNNSVIPGLHQLGAKTTALNGMYSGASQYIQDNVNRLAPGPAKAVGQNLVDTTVRPAINAQIMKNHVELAQKKQLFMRWHLIL